MRLWTRKRTLFQSFGQFVGQITKDAMLFVVCFAPILFGVFIKIGIPLIEKQLTEYFSSGAIMEPYYLILDLFLAIMTPSIFCFISAMVILGEIDDNISSYLAVTPLGKSGYLISRLGFPMIIGFFANIIVLHIFSLTSPSTLMIIGWSFLCGLMGVITSLMIVSLANNKVEGMAIAKLTGIITIGIPVPFFITGNAVYVLFFLPSFWIGKYAMENRLVYLLVGVIIALGWIYLLRKKFLKKVG